MRRRRGNKKNNNLDDVWQQVFHIVCGLKITQDDFVCGTGPGIKCKENVLGEPWRPREKKIYCTHHTSPNDKHAHVQFNTFLNSASTTMGFVKFAIMASCKLTFYYRAARMIT